MTRISKVHHHSHPAHAKKGYTSAKNAKRLITKYGQEKFNRIIMACENIKRLSRDLGLGDKELFKIAKYIEVKLKDKVKKGKVYLRKEKTHKQEDVIILIMCNMRYFTPSFLPNNNLTNAIINNKTKKSAKSFSVPNLTPHPKRPARPKPNRYLMIE